MKKKFLPRALNSISEFKAKISSSTPFAQSEIRSITLNHITHKEFSIIQNAYYEVFEFLLKRYSNPLGDSYLS